MSARPSAPGAPATEPSCGGLLGAARPQEVRLINNNSNNMCNKRNKNNSNNNESNNNNRINYSLLFIL